MSDLDELMARDPLELSAQDIDEIIKYHRTQRARRAAGEKPVKPSGPSADISHIVTKMVQVAKPPISIKRRI